MSDVTESVDVNVPVRTAYDQWTQFESFPEFMDGVESVRQTDARTTHWVTDIGGVRREFDAEITEQHPDERIAWKSTGGDTSHAGVVTFHRIAEAETRVTVQLVWEPRGFVEKVGSVLGIDNHQVKADTERFKKFIERRNGATGQWRGEVPAPRSMEQPADAAGPVAGAPVPGGRNDVVDVLLAQHEEIRQAFATTLNATGEAKEAQFDRLAAMLHAHETGEQQVTHRATHERTAGGDVVAAACLEEEVQAGHAMAELRALGVDHPAFDEKLESFHQAVLAHAAHEEQDEFPRLRELPVDQRHTLAADLRSAQTR